MPWDGGTDFTPGTKAFASLFNDRFAALAAYTDGIPPADLADGNFGALSLAAGIFSLRVQSARCSGDYTVGTAAGDVPGATVTAAANGDFIVLAAFDFLCESAAAPFAECLGIGTLVVGASTQGGSAQLMARTFSATEPIGRARATVFQWWLATANLGQAIKLQARRVDTGGGGNVVASGTHTGLVVIQRDS